MLFDSEFITSLIIIGGGLLAILIVIVVFELIATGWFSRKK